MKQNEELELKSKKLSEQLCEILKLKAQVRRLEQEKKSLQNEVQIARTEVRTYSLCLIFVLNVMICYLHKKVTYIRLAS